MLATPRRLAGVAMTCAVASVAVVPSAFAADEGKPVSVPAPNVSAIAKQHHSTVPEVLARQAKLAPIIQALTPKVPPRAQPGGLTTTRIAKAPVDDCFKAIGEPHVQPDASGNCPTDYKPMVNQDYVFGAVRAGNWVYYGTFVNPAASASVLFGAAQPFQTSNFVYEGAQGPPNPNPRAYRVNVDTHEIQDITPASSPNLQGLAGLRGQGMKDDVVIIGGPRIDPVTRSVSGIALFAWEGSTGKFLGDTLLPEYSNIRRGEVIKGQLYFGVRLSGAANGAGGAVIKWTGDKQDPFKFEIVARNLQSEPAYITEHDNHIITAGWTAAGPQKAVGNGAEMYESPAIPDQGGLTAATADPSNWKTIFRMSDYEPDPVVSRALLFGDLTSFKGKLMFSTYAYPGYTGMNAFTYYGKPVSEIDRLNTVVQADRAAAVLSMTDVGEPTQKVRLLYGDKQMPVYNTTTKKWQPKDNNLHQTPAFGPAGFGNRFNYYSWQWTTFKGKLYMSTFDGSTFFHDLIGMGSGPNQLDLSPETVALLQPVLDTVHNTLRGGDVWTMTSPDSPAVPFDLHGLGNPLSQGVRAWVPFEDKGKLIAGMSSFANINPNGTNGYGGWAVNEIK